MATKTTKKPRRAIGIARVSETRGQDGASLPEQRERIRDAADREHLDLLDVIDEPDVSGGTALADRGGLRRAVEAVEAGSAEVIIAAFFDRLVRSLRVQDELVSRVEAAGGRVMAVDVGDVTNGTAGQWLSATMLGAVAEHQRRTTAERTRGAQAAAIADGVPPWPGAASGYLRPSGKGEHAGLVPDPETQDAVAEAFQQRADGAAIREVREHLRERGVTLSYGATQRLLASRVVLGELHFGDLEPNLTAHEPIVDRDVWERAQRVRVPRGRPGRSERLLARLGVLRCGSCGSAMIADSANSGAVPTYRCGAAGRGDCDRPVSITAAKVEAIVLAEAERLLTNVEGRASVAARHRELVDRLERADDDYQGAMRTLAGMEDEAGARERLLELRQARDAAREAVERSGAGGAAITFPLDANFHRLPVEQQREAIRITIARVAVAPGRGDRIQVDAL